MSDSLPQFEVEDDLGTTEQYVGSVDTTNFQIPQIPTTAISEVLVRCPVQTPSSKRLLYSFNGGTTFDQLAPGEAIVWNLRGEPTSIIIKGNTTNVLYSVILNKQP